MLVVLHYRHVGVLEYMRSQGEEFYEAAEAFSAATGLENSSGNEGAKGLLEKKWTSVVRLQRKVCCASK